MKVFRIFVVIFFNFNVLTSYAQTPTELEWIKENTSELKTISGYDFSAIKKAIGDKQIVALGESTHGSGTFYNLKSELVRYLHKDMGFKVLAMESGLGDTFLAYENIDTLSSKQLRNFSVFGNFRANEANGLFDYLKSQSNTKWPLQYVGYDTQASSEFLFTKLKIILKEFDKELSDSLSTRMFSYQRSYGFGSNNDSINYLKHRDIFVETSNTARRYLEKYKDSIISKHKLNKTSYQVMVRSLSMFSASYNLSYADRWEGFGIRDSLMVENLKWLLKEVYPNKKVIIWAHNGHVEKGAMENGYMKTMGQFLKEQHPKDYYTIGLFANSGVSYQFWTKSTIPIEPTDSTFIEHRLISSGKNTPFLDLSRHVKTNNNGWIFESIQAFELENGGIIRFVPAKRFDAYIVVKESNAPTYND
ncbi:MAG: erythromycin esterase family protein [Flaviramulus sp.]|nr:erythromycin esterase family protein [Flaviramulus sp.]